MVSDDTTIRSGRTVIDTANGSNVATIAAHPVDSSATQVPKEVGSATSKKDAYSEVNAVNVPPSNSSVSTTRWQDISDVSLKEQVPPLDLLAGATKLATVVDALGRGAQLVFEGTHEVGETALELIDKAEDAFQQLSILGNLFKNLEGIGQHILHRRS